MIRSASLYWLVPVLGWWLWIAEVNVILSIAMLFAAGSAGVFLLYCEDKFLATRNYTRIPEAKLHLWEFLWGWPGAFAAQRIFRHKNRKVSYGIVFLLCIVLNLVLTWGIVRYHFRTPVPEKAASHR